MTGPDSTRWHPNRLSAALLVPLVLLTLGAAPTAAQAQTREALAARGEYLVNILGCGRCHTEGYLVGNSATGPFLAGSTVGIAYSAGPEGELPGLVFAGNLTPDPDTGIGTWTRRDLVRALTTGVGTDGHQRLPVMPWPNYGALNREDLDAIAEYLLNLPPVAREIPAATPPGQPIENPYVRFGIYVFTPFETLDAPGSDG